jgi:hypothetical protein
MTKYIVGFNMPGYMPDSEPSEYDNYVDAVEALIGELEQALDLIDDDADDSEKDEADELGEAIAGLQLHLNNLSNGRKPCEWGFTIGRYHYWLAID